MLGMYSNQPDDYTEQHADDLEADGVGGGGGADRGPPAEEPGDREGGRDRHEREEADHRRGVACGSRSTTPFTPGQGGACYLRVLKDRHGGVRQHCASRTGATARGRS